MAKKDNFWSNTFLGYGLKNIIKACILLGVIAAAVLISLNVYTKHGKTESVPELKELPLDEAISMLNRHNLNYEIIDSVYLRNKKLGTIVEQNPAPNTIVKPGRPVYLIINSKAVRKITLPDLRDISLRQAEAMAQSLGINIAGVEYASSEYKDLILDVKYKGQPLLPGSAIPEGGSIVLVAGSGIGGTASGVVPILVGLDLDAASSLLTSTSYILGGVIYDVPPSGNEGEYAVVAQRPEAGEPIAPGSVIDVWLSKDHTLSKDEIIPPKSKGEGKKEKDIEEFF